MKVLEKILFTVVVIALILKFCFVPSGDVLVMWSMLILGCIYYPLGFLFFNQIRLRNVFKKAAYVDVTGQRIALAVVAGLGLSIIIVGALFKLLSLAGANQMLMAGDVITLIIFIIALVLVVMKKDSGGSFILWRAGVIGILGIVLLFTPALAIVEFQYRNHPAYIEAYKNYLAEPGSRELYEKAELERNRIILDEEDFKMYEKSVERR